MTLYSRVINFTVSMKVFHYLAIELTFIGFAMNLALGDLRKALIFGVLCGTSNILCDFRHQGDSK